MVHDPTTRRQDNIPKLSTRQQFHHPLLEISDSNIVSRGYDAGFVDAPVELDDDFAGAVVVDFFEFADVACLVKILISLGWDM